MKSSGVFAASLLAACVFAASQCQAQVAAYGEFSATKAQNLVDDYILYGGTAGVLFDKPTLWKRLTFGGDARGRFLHADHFDLDSVTVGPRLKVSTVKHLEPYAELLVGFARIHNTADQASASTDATLQINAGVMKPLTPRFDVIGEYSYSQLYAFGGEYNPKTFSVGVAYYFTKR